MAGAFQSSAFQRTAFQTDAVITGAAGGRKGGDKRRVFVEIDGHTFPVRNAQEARELLAQARESAQATAQESARQAVRAQPTAEPEIVPPRISVKYDIPDLFAQQVMAQVEAAQAQIAQTYRTAMAEAYAAAVDEEEAIIALLLD